jgi:hypothetical protein
MQEWFGVFVLLLLQHQLGSVQQQTAQLQTCLLVCSAAARRSDRRSLAICKRRVWIDSFLVKLATAFLSIGISRA